MKHLFVPYEIALALKEMGFDEECPCYWRVELGFDPVLVPLLRRFTNANVSGIRNSDLLAENEIAAPLYQQVVDWFREKHEVPISVIDEWSQLRLEGYYTRVSGGNLGHGLFKSETFTTYYEALNEGINHALKLL